MNKTQRILTKTHLIASVVPWAVLVYFTLYAFAVRSVLGHWPVLFENTPAGFLKTISRGGDVALIAMLLSGPIWLFVLGLRIAFGTATGRTVWRAALVFALGWCAFCVAYAVDPVHFVDWLID